MRYLYYPGCSLKGTAKEYDLSTRACMKALGVEVEELEDWTCCGATAAQSVSRLLSLALPARNLALAEKQNKDLDLLVPCSACYLNLKMTEEKARTEPGTLQEINQVLAEAGLHMEGTVRVRHLLDVLSRDLGAREVAARVTRPLEGLTLAPYYGCQCLRPYPVFDDPEAPTSMEPLLRATGAEIHAWTMGSRCCGASHMTVKPHIGIDLVAPILDAASGADAVVTVCPMCQMNLEAYQDKASRALGRDVSVTVIYLPQLIGLALGLSSKDVRLDLNLAVTRAFQQRAA